MKLGHQVRYEGGGKPFYATLHGPMVEAECATCGGPTHHVGRIDRVNEWGLKEGEPGPPACNTCLRAKYGISLNVKSQHPRFVGAVPAVVPPTRPPALCRRCGVVLDQVHVRDGYDVHPICDRTPMQFQDIPGEDSLKTELTNIFLWTERNSPRSKQVAPGPSEIGDPCDRRLGMKLAGLPIVNKRMDPWPAIVGTAIHSWSEKAVLAFQEATGVRDWLTEQVVELDPMISGHSDLYHIPRSAVVDLKTAGTDAMKKIHANGPPPGYITQVQLYGLGYENSNIPVKEVALVFVPRNGWLADMRVYSWPYDRSLAEEALARMYRIANRLMELDILNQPHRWIEVEASPGRNCVWCPFYDPREPERGPGADGCGGV